LPDLNNTAREIESRYGVKIVRLTPADLRCTFCYDLAAMRERGFDEALVEEHRPFNDMIDSFVSDLTIGDYLANTTPAEIYLASGVRVLTLAAIQEEIAEFAPGAILFPMGYLPFATSIGGHAVSFDLNLSRVVWVDHSFFGSDSITYYDRHTNRIVEKPLTAENVAAQVVPLSSNFWTFFDELIRGQLEDKLDHLDRG
jgi:hypothetical protein